MLCAVAFGGRGMFNGNIVGYEIASQARNDAQGAELLLAIARKDLNVREEGCANCGRRIKIYLDYVGIRQAAPWCAAAISTWFREAGFPAPRTAWSPSMFPKDRVVELGGRLKASLKTDPRVANTDPGEVKTDAGGLVLGIYFPSLKRIGHVGLVEYVKGDYIHSIEANTNVIGSREGDGVYRKIRHRRTIYKYSDWLN